MAKISELSTVQSVEQGDYSYILLSGNYGDSGWMSNKMSIANLVSDIKDNYNMTYTINGVLCQSAAEAGRAGESITVPYLVYYDGNAGLSYYDAAGNKQAINLNYDPCV